MEQLPFQKQADEQYCENDNKRQSHLLPCKHRTPHQEGSHKKYREKIRDYEPSHEELCKNPLMRWYYLGRASRLRHNQASVI